MFIKRLGRYTIILAVTLPYLTNPSLADEGAESNSQEIFNSQSTGIEISGFGEFYADVNNRDDADIFNIGQAEIDLLSAPNEKIEIALAVVYEETSFQIGAFTAEYEVWKRSDLKNNRLGFQRIAFGAGQFDVPFGLDRLFYPSIDRKLVSMPLAVELTHGGWNDRGLYAVVEARRFTLDAFVVNGLELNGDDNLEEQSPSLKRVACGGRFGLNPAAFLEFGGSMAMVLGQGNDCGIDIIGADLQFSVGRYFIKSEYVSHCEKNAAEIESTHRGFYIQGKYDLGQWFTVAQYGQLETAGEQDSMQSRLSAGLGHRVNEYLELRFEYKDDLGGSDESSLFQMVMQF